MLSQSKIDGGGFSVIATKRVLRFDHAIPYRQVGSHMYVELGSSPAARKGAGIKKVLHLIAERQFRMMIP